jgi:hypothetical protein
MNITKKIFLMNSLRINIKTSHNRIIGVLTAPCVQCLHNQTGKNNNRTSRVSQNIVHLSQKNFSNSSNKQYTGVLIHIGLHRIITFIKSDKFYL